MEKTEMVKLGSAFSVPEMTVLGPQIIQRLEWNCTRPDDPNFKLSRVCWDCNKGFSGYLWTTWFLGIISLRGTMTSSGKKTTQPWVKTCLDASNSLIMLLFESTYSYNTILQVLILSSSVHWLTGKSKAHSTPHRTVFPAAQPGKNVQLKKPTGATVSKNVSWKDWSCSIS